MEGESISVKVMTPPRDRFGPCTIYVEWIDGRGSPIRVASGVTVGLP